MNITGALRRIATLCGASWPYQQAETVIRELTGIEISHDHIKNLCESEASIVAEGNQETYSSLVFSQSAFVGVVHDECLGAT